MIHSNEHKNAAGSSAGELLRAGAATDISRTAGQGAAQPTGKSQSQLKGAGLRDQMAIVTESPSLEVITTSPQIHLDGQQKQKLQQQ